MPMKYFAVFVVMISIIFGTHVQAKDVHLRNKIGQMLILGFEGKEIAADSHIAKAITYSNIGGVILFDFNSETKQFDKNIKSPQQVKELNANLQKIAADANKQFNRPALPLLISVDYEGGKVNRLKEAYGFPPTESAAEVGKSDSNHAHQVAKTMALTLSQAGFNLNFAPLVDVNINPDNPIIGMKQRSFSADPNEVAKYASIYAQSLLNHHIQCVFKHFPGHGSSRDDSHLAFVDVTHFWQPEELEPYRQLLNNTHTCGMIMTAHIVNRQLDDSGLPATLSHTMLTDILRNRLNFKGVVISDDMQMSAIRDYYGLEQALTLAINAGVDMFIFGNQLLDHEQADPEDIIDIIIKQVKLGHITESRINEAYQHIISFKQSI